MFDLDALPDPPLPQALPFETFRQRTADWPEQWRVYALSWLQGLGLLESMERRAIRMSWMLLAVGTGVNIVQVLGQPSQWQQLLKGFAANMMFVTLVTVVIMAIDWWVIQRIYRHKVIKTMDGFQKSLREESDAEIPSSLQERLVEWGGTLDQPAVLQKVFPEISSLVRQYHIH